ncbi:hypothetical protein DNTS_020275 [Danionella cerebrum]|uniref:SEA domain-containing protein n=1 Tax=Danionella cerebrum TaxID=2873325 RepID=A0A553Q0E3_9TELE|nr:hypothetical protein DNTS_020275 [Danionella translucida]
MQWCFDQTKSNQPKVEVLKNPPAPPPVLALLPCQTGVFQFTLQALPPGLLRARSLPLSAACLVVWRLLQGVADPAPFSPPALEQDDASGSSPSSMHLLGTFLMTDRNPATVVQSGLKGLSKDAREEPAFSSIFTLIASTAQKPPEAPGDAAGHEIETRPRPSNKSSNSFPSSVPVSNQSNTDSTKRTGTVASARSTSADPNHQTKNSGRRSPEPRAPSNRSSASVVHQERTFVAATAAQSQSTTSNTATTASTPFITTKTTSAAKRRSKTVVRTTTTGLPDSPKTTPRARSASTAQTAKPGSSRSTIGPPLAAATEAMTIRCNITDRMWIKTVLSVQLRRSRLDSILKQNLPRGFTQALKKALNDSRVQATLESISSVPNVTVGYYVTSGEMVYTPSVVVEALGVYGIERLMADVRQFVPLVQAVRIPAVPWRTSPNVSLMLKTGPADDVRSCRFNQMMERRLENAFEEAEAIVMNSHSSLSVQALGSPAVSLMYVVYNGSVALNGTAASTLLSHLTAELVGYFLFYPPLITAEPLEYHNLNTSIETRLFWIVTVIQDVSNSSLEAQYQSFASLMEERLAEIFMVVHQQGVRFKRATTVGSYTVQMVRIRRVHGPKNPAEMTYYVQQSGSPLLGASAAKLLNTVDSQTMALTLGYFVQLQAEAVVKNPPNNLWIIAAVLAPIAVVTLIIIIITIILCHKNKSEYKADSVGSYNPRVKTGYWRDVGYYPQPVQGFDYAKQHLGRQGSDDQALQVTQDTNVPPHPIKDAPLSLEKPSRQDGSVSKKSLNSVMRKRLPSEDGSVISSESVKEVSGKGSSVRKATAQKKPSKEESRKSHGEEGSGVTSR